MIRLHLKMLWRLLRYGPAAEVERLERAVRDVPRYVAGLKVDELRRKGELP